MTFTDLEAAKNALDSMGSSSNVPKEQLPGFLSALAAAKSDYANELALSLGLLEPLTGLSTAIQDNNKLRNERNSSMAFQVEPEVFSTNPTRLRLSKSDNETEFWQRGPFLYTEYTEALKEQMKIEDSASVQMTPKYIYMCSDYQYEFTNANNDLQLQAWKQFGKQREVVSEELTDEFFVWSLDPDIDPGLGHKLVIQFSVLNLANRFEKGDIFIYNNNEFEVESIDPDQTKTKLIVRVLNTYQKSDIALTSYRYIRKSGIEFFITENLKAAVRYPEVLTTDQVASTIPMIPLVHFEYLPNSTINDSAPQAESTIESFFNERNLKYVPRYHNELTLNARKTAFDAILENEWFDTSSENFADLNTVMGYVRTDEKIVFGDNMGQSLNPLYEYILSKEDSGENDSSGMFVSGTPSLGFTMHKHLRDIDVDVVAGTHLEVDATGEIDFVSVSSSSKEILQDIQDKCGQINPEEYDGLGTLSDYKDLIVQAQTIQSNTLLLDTTLDNLNLESVKSVADNIGNMINSLTLTLQTSVEIDDTHVLNQISAYVTSLVGLQEKLKEFKLQITLTRQVNIPDSISAANTELNHCKGKIDTIMKVMENFVTGNGDLTPQEKVTYALNAENQKAINSAQGALDFVGNSTELNVKLQNSVVNDLQATVNSINRDVMARLQSVAFDMPSWVRDLDGVTRTKTVIHGNDYNWATITNSNLDASVLSEVLIPDLRVAKPLSELLPNETTLSYFVTNGTGGNNGTVQQIIFDFKTVPLEPLAVTFAVGQIIRSDMKIYHAMQITSITSNSLYVWSDNNEVRSDTMNEVLTSEALDNVPLDGFVRYKLPETLPDITVYLPFDITAQYKVPGMFDLLGNQVANENLNYGQLNPVNAKEPTDPSPVLKLVSNFLEGWNPVLATRMRLHINTVEDISIQTAQDVSEDFKFEYEDDGSFKSSPSFDFHQYSSWTKHILDSSFNLRANQKITAITFSKYYTTMETAGQYGLDTINQVSDTKNAVERNDLFQKIISRNRPDMSSAAGGFQLSYATSRNN